MIVELIAVLYLLLIHADLLIGVRIGHRIHRWVSPDGVTPGGADGAEMSELAADLGRVLHGAPPLH